jgi:hypothetical protein
MLAVLVGVAVFVLYARGACPTIYVGDSGELVTAVHVLGIPHPSGYPLYVLLGKLWTLAVPAGSIAWRMSLFSAAAAAGACAGLFQLARRAGVHPAAAATAALLLAASPSFWGEANVQRVYALGALFLIVTVAAAWRWHERRDGRSFAAAWLACGLAVAAHGAMAALAAALALLVVASEPRVLVRPRRLAGALAGFGVGVLPYAYLPLRSRADPVLDWGDPETLRAFVDVVVRREFWSRAWIETPADLLAIGADWLRSLGTELTWAGVALALVGIVAGRRRGWPVLLPLAVMATNVVAVALHGSRTDLFFWHRYYLPSYAMTALLAGLGCHVVVAGMPAFARVAPLALPLVLLVRGWPAFDRSRYRIAEDFALAVLRAVPPGAHLAATDDNILFTLMYLHHVEGRRPDVDLILQGVSGAAPPRLRFHPDREPLFFTHHPNWQLDTLDVVPVGLVFQARRPGATPRDAPAMPAALDGEHDPGVPKDYLTQNLIGHFRYMRGLTLAERDWAAAEREFDAAMAAAPENDVLFYNLGLVFQRRGLLDRAAAAFARSHEINPRHLQSASRPRAADRLADIEAARAGGSRP